MFFLAASLLATAAAPLLSPSCKSSALSNHVRAQEAATISLATKRTVTPKRIDYLLQSGSWKLVWTTPPQDARSVYLFKRLGTAWRLVDTWHGDLGTDDPQAGLDWATTRHVPADLTTCFGTVLVNHP